MKNKIVLVLLGILHICIFALALFTMHYFVVAPTPVSISAETPTVESESSTLETEMFSEPEEVSTTPFESNIAPDTYIEEESSEVESTEVTSELYPSEYAIPYTFTYNGNKRLNIRDTPSMDGNVIGKVLPDGQGSVIAIVDNEWVEITYDGITGYCNSSYIFPEEY